MLLGHPHCCWHLELVPLSTVIFFSSLSKRKKKQILLSPALSKFMSSAQFPFGKSLPLSKQPWSPDLSVTHLYFQGSLPLPTTASPLYVPYLSFSSLNLWILYLIISKGNFLCFQRGQLDNLINYCVLMWLERIRHIRIFLTVFFNQILQFVLHKCKY